MTQQAYDFSLLFDQQEVRTKLLNYTGIRFTMCARVMVNATPFDSGSVFLVYRPPGFVNRTLNLANALPIKNYALKPPHSFIDLSEESAVELRVPYYSPKRFLTTLECFAEGRLGDFQVASFFENFCSNSTQYKLYFWMEDVELLYPTNLFETIPKWVPQGPPTSKVSGGEVVLSQALYDTNYKVSAQTVPAAMNIVNKDYTQDSTNTFEEIFQTNDYAFDFNLPVGQEINHFYEVGPSHAPATCRMTLLPHFFMMYSGSIEYTFKAFKTKFHSGRLQIAFLPKWLNTLPIPDKLDDFWNVIWDFRENSELKITIPYVDDKFMTLSDGSQGRLVIRTAAVMQAPDNVEQNVPVMITARMCDDLQLACPRQSMNFDRMPQIAAKSAPVVWNPQGPINDGDVETPTNYVNEGTCTLREYCEKGNLTVNYGQDSTLVKPHVLNGIYFPATPRSCMYKNTGTMRLQPGSQILANMFEFYRGDVIVPAAVAPDLYYYRAHAGTQNCFPYILICDIIV